MPRLILLGILFATLPLIAHVGRAAEYFDETKAVTIFAFDSVSIPHTQNLRLEMREPKRHPANPVLQRGAPGTPDAKGVQFYGSILREVGKHRLWYVASARWHGLGADAPMRCPNGSSSMSLLTGKKKTDIRFSAIYVQP